MYNRKDVLCRLHPIHICIVYTGKYIANFNNRTKEWGVYMNVPTAHLSSQLKLCMIDTGADPEFRKRGGAPF